MTHKSPVGPAVGNAGLALAFWWVHLSKAVRFFSNKTAVFFYFPKSVQRCGRVLLWPRGSWTRPTSPLKKNLQQQRMPGIRDLSGLYHSLPLSMVTLTRFCKHWIPMHSLSAALMARHGPTVHGARYSLNVRAVKLQRSARSSFFLTFLTDSNIQNLAKVPPGCEVNFHTTYWLNEITMRRVGYWKRIRLSPCVSSWFFFQLVYVTCKIIWMILLLTRQELSLGSKSPSSADPSQGQQDHVLDSHIWIYNIYEELWRHVKLILCSEDHRSRKTCPCRERGFLFDVLPLWHASIQYHLILGWTCGVAGPRHDKVQRYQLWHWPNLAADLGLESCYSKEE